MLLSLNKAKGHLANLNTRAEMHGADSEPAADLKLVFNLPNDYLAQFDPGLKGFLYHFDSTADHDLAEEGKAGDPNFLPNRKLIMLDMPIKWSDEMLGGECVIHVGIGGKSDIRLKDIKVGAVSIDAKEGGTIELAIRVQCKPDEKQIGKLFHLIRQAVEVSVTPPEGAPVWGAAAHTGGGGQGKDSGPNPDFREPGDDAVED